MFLRDVVKSIFNDILFKITKNRAGDPWQQGKKRQQ